VERHVTGIEEVLAEIAEAPEEPDRDREWLYGRVPALAVAPMLLGPFGGIGLEARYGDVLLGRQRDLMEALFPPVTSDLLTFYLPL
jgi:hypothetical protein